MARDALYVLLGVVAGITMSAAGDADLYGALKLDLSATDDEIKIAFRKLSLEYHPDRSTGDQAKFLELQKAYKVLSNPDLRMIYDFAGMETVEQVAKGGVMVKRTPDEHYTLRVTLKQIYNGDEVVLERQRRAFCPKCRGSGAQPNSSRTLCHACHGQGSIFRVQQIHGFMMQIQEECGVCAGTGRVAMHQCDHCHGNRIIDERTQLKVMIERGVEEGHQVVFERQASCAPKLLPGNFIVTLETQPHPKFTRVNSTALSRTVSIPLRHALLGFKSSIPHLDDHKVVLDRRGEITPFGFVQVVKGEGMPVHGSLVDRGDLLVHFRVKFPLQLSDSQRNEIRRVFGPPTERGEKDEL